MMIFVLELLLAVIGIAATIEREHWKNKYLVESFRVHVLKKKLREARQEARP